MVWHIQDVVGERGLYDHNMATIRELGGFLKVSRLRFVRKKGLDAVEIAKPRTELTAEEKAEYDKCRRVPVVPIRY